MLICTLWLCLYGGWWDVVVVDQVPTCIPLLRIFNRRVFYYCHYPDKLLCVERSSWLKKAYRFVLDYMEEITTAFANIIVFNSKFTENSFYSAFRILNKFRRKLKTAVLYPAQDFDNFERVYENESSAEDNPGEIRFLSELASGSVEYFYSLNRYERKKNIPLALRAFARLKEKYPRTNLKMVHAGGYDLQCRENIEHFSELTALGESLGITADLILLKNVTNSERADLLKHSACVLYTPENEHFGIVPVEAMHCRTPVICCDSGGPRESVADGITGYLIPSEDIDGWVDKMAMLSRRRDVRKDMGEKGR